MLAEPLPAEQKWAVVLFAALSAGVEGPQIESTFAVSAKQARSESRATNRMPDESAVQFRTHDAGRVSVESAWTTSGARVFSATVKSVEPELQWSWRAIEL